MEQKRIPRSKQRYSRRNPPLVRGAAQERLQILQQDIARIQAQLDRDDHPLIGAPEYDEWRDRAVAAAGFTEKEIRYLERWVAARERRESSAEDYESDPAAFLIKYRELIEYARTLAGELGQGYTVLYSQTCSPETMAEARHRIAELAAVRSRLQDAFSEVSTRCVEIGLRERGAISRIKAPLQKLLSCIERERRFARSYIQAQSSPEVSDWMVVYADVLARAVSQGFVLTPQEQTVLGIPLSLASAPLHDEKSRRSFLGILQSVTMRVQLRAQRCAVRWMVTLRLRKKGDKRSVL